MGKLTVFIVVVVSGVFLYIQSFDSSPEKSVVKVKKTVDIEIDPIEIVTINREDAVESSDDLSDQSIDDVLSEPMIAYMKDEASRFYQPLFDELALAIEDQQVLENLVTAQVYLLLQKSLSVRYSGARIVTKGEDGLPTNINTDDIDIDDIKRKEALVDTEISSLLGEDNYSKYDYFKNTIQERSYINKVGLALSREFRPLDYDQEKRLIEEAYKIRTKPEYQALTDNVGVMGDITTEEMHELEVAYNREIEALEYSVLSEDQFEILSGERRGG